jgi:diguanylate cyclase (GGDEF)-like protein
MSSLKRNLEWLFAALAIIGAVLLTWGLYAEWQGIEERHELRQRSQIGTIANATHAVFNSQETVLSLMGTQLMVHWRMGQVAAIGQTFETMLDINEPAAGYGLLGPDFAPVAVRWRPDIQQSATRPDVPGGETTCELARSVRTMVIGPPVEFDAEDRRYIPVCKAMRNEGGEIGGFVSAALALEGPDSFFADQAALGRTNIVQVVRESDLSSLLWATALELPSDYLAQPVSRDLYERAIRSAEKLNDTTFSRIRDSGRAYPYRLETGLGLQMGMAQYDSRYGFWVLTQTNRDELLSDWLRVAWVYIAIFIVVLLSVLAVLLAIGRAERKRRDDLIRQANHDMLTGLPNRQSMGEDFERMRRRYGTDFALMFIDMDNFKAVNDGFGHVQGDAVLQILGRRLDDFVAGEECVARVGGDEFVILTPETDESRLVERAEALVQNLTERYVVEGVRYELGCSVGIARVADAGDSLNDVLRAADVAMYSAKRQHNAARLFEPAMGRVYLENIRIEQKLRSALEDGSVYLVYQPQVDASENVVGVEALARWDDPELGRIGPARFVSIAEASGVIGRVGDYIVDRCLSDARVMRDSLQRPLRLSINVSVRQFLRDEFAAALLERVRVAELPDMTPIIEITENLFVEDYETINEEARAMRDAGIRIALDDFGTGYSSLSLLRNLPVDELKIDKSFIDHLESEDSALKLVQSIVAIGHNHGLTIVAEGVETHRQFEMLREAGCDVFQGYLFARPMRLDDLLSDLSHFS